VIGNMKEDLFRLKVACLFHDPPIKPLASWKLKKGHEEVAKEIIENLNKKLPNSVQLNSYIMKSNIIEHADWVAASSDRFIISELYSGNVDKIIAINILNMNGKDLNETYSKLPNNWYEEFKKSFPTNLFEDINIEELVNNNQLHIIYHIIWRFLIEATVRSLNNLKDFALLPADTRVPYYTIYDHLYTSSGFLVSLKDDQNIGRVGIIHWEAIGTQSFIQESRAFRDLWASSFLISLMNTVIIIKLAKEHGFDSILNPNMLYNPLIDLYLYAHTKDERLNISYEELRNPITPDKGFAIVPYTKVEDFVKEIPKWFNELWKIIAKTVKEHIENELKDSQADIFKDSLKEYLCINEDIGLEKFIKPILSWKDIWEKVGYDIPINFICVGEKLELKQDSLHSKLNELKKYLLDLYNENELDELLKELKVLREIAKNKGYHDEFQFFEFPLIIEILKKKKKLRAELPRIDAPKWILKSDIYIKDRKLVCSICYKRPAIIFGNTSVTVTRLKLYEIKEDERLCPICLTKRLLARQDLFTKILSKVYEYADNSINYKDYESVINDLKDKYEKVLLEKLNIPRNILTVPSLDTISTLTFRSSLIKYTPYEIEKIINKIKEIELNNNKLFKDMPHPEWFKDYKDKLENMRILLVGGEYFLVDELEKIYRNNTNMKSKIKELEDIFKEITEDIKKLEYIKIKDREIVATKPGKYVTLIKADGDNMGKLFTLTDKYRKQIKDILPKELNEYLRKDEEEIIIYDKRYTIKDIKSYRYIPTPSFYAYISRTLSSIARNITKIANDYATVIVYAGGDDILAIAPVELSLLFANQARKVFSLEWIDLDNYNIIIQGLTDKSTQSFAIRYFHVFSPLFKELANSNDGLELAKCIEGKNGLIITYNPRSGNKLQATLKWKDDIIRRIFNISSITLKYKRIIQDNDMKLLSVNRSLSDRVFRDIITIANNYYSNNIISAISQREFKRHTSNNSNLLQTIECNIDNIAQEIKVNNEDKHAILELIKGVLAFTSSLDSMPLVLGDRL
jgi:CRISPR-associated protein Cas10/Cmr2 subtype III-B